MRFRLLGGLEVEDDNGDHVVLSAFKLRALLAFLLLNANEVVTRDVLVDVLWDGSPPRCAEHGLDVLVSRLRRVLHERLRTVPGGYVLTVHPGELDIDRFATGVGEARKHLAGGRFDEAVECFGRALGEWHGAPLGDVAYEFFAETPAAQLDELRVEATEDLLATELRLGRHAGVVPALEALVAGHPLRERARALLMVALYRSGRHSDALEAYRQGCHMLMEEHGLTPGEELRRLEREILQHDPALDAATDSLPYDPDWDTEVARRIMRSAGRRRASAAAR